MANGVLTLGQASRIAECSRDTLRRAAQREELKAELAPGKKGQQWWIREADLRDWLESRGKAGGTQTSAAPEQAQQGLEQQLAEHKKELKRAQQEIARLQDELRQAQQRSSEAVQQLKTARGLVEDWQGQSRLTSLRKLLGF